MKLKVKNTEIIAIVLSLLSFIGVLLTHIYSKDINISASKIEEHKKDIETFKAEYKAGMADFKRARERDNDKFLRKVEAVGKAQTDMLQKIYEQNSTSSKAVDAVRIELARSTSNDVVLSSKIDSLLARVEKNDQRISYLENQEKKINALQQNVLAINKALVKIGKNKNVEVFGLKYGFEG